MDLENGMSLLDVVKHAKPTIILGLTGQSGLFTEEIIKEMYKYCERPIIFPMSNPTKNSECTAKDAYTWTEGKCVFASGSPFEPVELNGVTYYPSQSNNMYIFPGLGLAATSVQATRISYPMLHQATMALSNSLTIEEMQLGLVFPSINRIRDVSLLVATAVAREAYDRQCTNGRVPRPSNLPNFLHQKMWEPHYPNIICTRS
jgi:malate dehydrogenase (oxaloacetate-decarboxylating)(NADP+)